MLAKLLAFSAPQNNDAHTRWASKNLAERTGLAHILRAADSLASESLRSPSKAKSLAFSAPENNDAHTRWASKTLAERTGLEPATPGVTGRYSNQLNYRSAAAYSTTVSLQLHLVLLPVRLASPRGFEPLLQP